MAGEFRKLVKSVDRRVRSRVSRYDCRSVCLLVVTVVLFGAYVYLPEDFEASTMSLPSAPTQVEAPRRPMRDKHRVTPEAQAPDQQRRSSKVPAAPEDVPAAPEVAPPRPRQPLRGASKARLRGGSTPRPTLDRSVTSRDP
jgi:hypothetical protein